MYNLASERKHTSKASRTMALSKETGDTILMVGFICYDLVFSATHYPEEDSMNRALDYHVRRGENASNSCTVLSQLGAKCELQAVMAGDEYAKFLQKDLQEDGILFHHCPVYPDKPSPFTSIVLSASTGSRTIMHYRPHDYPEVKFEDFSKLDLSTYKWIHFEGRGLPETLKMIDFLDDWNAKRSTAIPYSVELEKCSNQTKALLLRGDTVFVAKEFAKFMGYAEPFVALNGLASLVKQGATIILPWGEQGAMVRRSNGTILKFQAHPPPSVVDTIGAGDTFIAATVFYLSQSKSVEESIDFGCQIAGSKCGMMGYRGIRAVHEKIKKDGK